MRLIDNTGLSYLIGKIETLIGLKADKTYVDNKVKTDVPLNAKFTDTIVDISGKADKTYVDNKVKTDVPLGAKFTDTIYTHPTNHPASMITGLPTSLPASGGNADTVGGFTVGVSVPAGAKFTDTVYTHPANHPPSIISQDSNNRFVTDTEKATWNGKSNFSGNYNDLSNKPTIPDTSTLMPISGGVLENYREKLTTVSASGGSINLSLGNVFQHTPSGNTTYSITNAVNSQAHSFTLIITQTATVRTLTFPASVKWQGGEIPDMSTANKTYVLTFLSINGGTTWLGMFGGEF